MKTALVTGAARGIGLATTRLFLEQGWRAVMVDRDADALAEAAGQAQAQAICADVSIPEDVARIVTEAGLDGGLHALVNNAGVADFGPI